MTGISDILAALLLVGGAGIVGTAALGIARLPDSFTRMHAATKAGVVGCGLVLLGAALALDGAAPLWTAAFGIVFLLATSPIASHVLGRAAYLSGAPLAPRTVGNTLDGVLDRRIFDLESVAANRPRRERAIDPEEDVMKALQFRDPAAMAALADPAKIRRIVCWLSAVDGQSAATLVGIELARATGGRLTGFSGADPEALALREPVPIGGSYWARRLTDSRRRRAREASSEALARFGAQTEAGGVEVEARHEEGDLAALMVALASQDLIVVPAGTDHHGRSCPPAEELATRVSNAGFGPVLRVQRRPSAVRRVLLVVGSTSHRPKLASTLVGSGLWPRASITVLPANRNSSVVVRLAREEAELLLAHGREATVAEPLSLDIPADEMRRRIDGHQVAVMATLSDRVGWFGAVREDVHGVVADTVAVSLLP